MRSASPRSNAAASLLAAWLTAASSLFAQGVQAPEGDDSTSTVDDLPTGKAAPAALEGLYAWSDSGSARLGPGDAVRITVYRQPEASGEYTVDEFGHLLLPLVGPVDVTGKSVARLKNEVAERFREFFHEPMILITPLYRVNVLGAVREPGLYPVDPTMILSDVLALAGGLTPDGSLGKIHILRSGREQTFDFGESAARARQVGEFGLRSGDQIIVGEKGKSFWEVAPFAASALAALATLLAVSN